MIKTTNWSPNILIEAKDMANGITPSMVKSYLEKNGWIYQDVVDDSVEVWLKHFGDSFQHVRVPLNLNWSDYGMMVGSLVENVSKRENIPPILIICQIRQIDDTTKSLPTVDQQNRLEVEQIDGRKIRIVLEFEQDDRGGLFYSDEHEMVIAVQDYGKIL